MDFAVGDVVVVRGSERRFRLTAEINQGIHIYYTLWDAVELPGNKKGPFIFNSQSMTKVPLLEQLAWAASD